MLLEFRTGLPRRDLPERFGPWQPHRRSGRRWAGWSRSAPPVR
ncbi:hypothetical protein [Streptomyces sp. NPDC056431]